MSNVTDQTRKLGEIKAAKRAEALRSNLKRRKDSEAVKIAKGGHDAKPENRK